MAKFLSRRTAQVLVAVGVFDNLAFRIRSSMKDVGQRLSCRRGLLASRRFGFLLFVGFALFLLACDC
jgi:hypothetical protein